MGNTVPWNWLSVEETSAFWPAATSPFSRNMPKFRVPETTVRNSVARGWTCGVLRPQGLRKPRVVEMPREVRIGKVSMFWLVLVSWYI